MADEREFVTGRARAKVWAALTLGAAVAACSAIAIADAQGHSVRPDKAKSCNTNFGTGCVAGSNAGDGAGALGNNTGTGDGVDGNSTGSGGNGVTGTSNTQDGVEGESFSTNNPGVYGTSAQNGAGVEGTAGSGAGVVGLSTSGYGTEGQSSGKNAGVGGFSNSSTPGAAGVYGQAVDGFGVYGFNESSSGYGLFSQGNAFVEGEIFTSGSCKDGCTRTRQIAAFAARTTQPTIDDVGEATLRDGVAHVSLAADFANTIDSHKPYVVMLTPEGDAALYVANRMASGFEVREIGGGRSSVAFAYRIVAKPYGLKDERLPVKILPDAATFKQPLIGHRSR